MPKHGWKWRTERLRAMAFGDLTALLQDHGAVSARLARWAYENLAGDDAAARVFALETVAVDPRATWARAWLWRELERHKGDPFGDWVVIALTRSGVESVADALPFIRLYRDPTAHPHTRGSAIFGLSNALGVPELKPESPHPDAETWAKARWACQEALRDEANPYARAGACWLAAGLGGFEDELRRLAQDRTRLHCGGKVSDYAEDDVDPEEAG